MHFLDFPPFVVEKLCQKVFRFGPKLFVSKQQQQKETKNAAVPDVADSYLSAIGERNVEKIDWKPG